MNDGNEITSQTATKTASPKKRPASQEPLPSITRDERLGPYAADATHWRCRRVEDGSNGNTKGAPLFWGDEESVQLSEWPIATLTIETIRDRWGAGRYVVHYFRLDAAGTRIPRGRSRVVQFVGSDDAPPEVVIAAPRAAAPPHPLLAMGGSDPNYVFSILTFLEDRSDKARNAAVAEARAMADRERAHWEAMMERDRIAYERTENARLQYQSKASTDTEALVDRVANAVTARLQGGTAAYQPPSNDEEDDYEPAKASSPLEKMLAENGPQIIAAILALAQEHLSAKKPPTGEAA